jgi:hypothetical protein
MNYRDRIIDLEYKTRVAESTKFLKLADKKSSTNSGSTLKDILLVGGGTALGAGAGYGLGAFMKKRYGAAIKGADPRARLKWLVPAGAAAGGALALTQVLRQQSGRKSKK